jgi:hypothetical protein
MGRAQLKALQIITIFTQFGLPGKRFGHTLGSSGIKLIWLSGIAEEEHHE